MSNKNRKYYKINDKGVSSSEKKAFLLKWISDKTGDVMQGGPYSNEKDATDLLSKHLKNGVCSWLVAYND